jgi:hypothetical protein
MIVDARSDAVDSADKGALAAADHPKSDPAALVGVAASLDSHAFLPGAVMKLALDCFLIGVVVVASRRASHR